MQDSLLTGSNHEDLISVHSHYFELSDDQKEYMISKEKGFKQMKVPNDPHHPMLYHVYSETLPLEQAYRIEDKRRYWRAPTTLKEAKICKQRWLHEG